MGLLDWLTEGVGSDMGGSSMGSGYKPPPPMPPMQAPDAAPAGDGADLAPPRPVVRPPEGPGLPAPADVPLPVARPPGADMNSNASYTPKPSPLMPQSGGEPPPPMSLAPANPPPASIAGQTALGRALGINPKDGGNIMREFGGGLGKGLTAAAGASHEPGLAAFAAGAGGAMTGSEDVRKTLSGEQDKYLTRAIAFAQAGNTKAANEALTELRKAQTKQIQDGKGDKASVMNSTEQLYLRGLGAVNQNPQIKASAAQLKAVQTQFGVDSKEAKAAMTAHNSLIETEKKRVLGNLGINEKDAAKIGEKPGFSEQNPVKSFPKDAGAAKKAYDALPEGAWFINPKDGQLRIKQSKPPAAAGANPAAAPQSPPTAPPMTDPAQAPAPAAAAEEED